MIQQIDKIYIYKCLTICFLVGLVAFQFYKVFNYPIWQDGAIFGTAAKGLSSGIGYVAVYYDEIIKFDRMVTAGPAIILPLSLFISLLGNNYWVPSLFAVLLLDLLLLIFLKNINKVCEEKNIWSARLIFLVLLVLTTSIEIGVPDEKMMLWHSLLPDITSTLFVVLATLWVSDKHYNKLHLLYCGVLAGVGGMCKLQAFIGGGSLGIYLAISYLNSDNSVYVKIRTIATNCLYYFTGLFIPFILFELYKIKTIGFSLYVENLERWLFYFSKLNDPNGNQSKIIANSHNYLFLFIVLVVHFCAVVYFYLTIKRNNKYTIKEDWTANALLFCAMIGLFWFVVICSIPVERYTVYVTVYLCAAVALFSYKLLNDYKAYLVFPFILVIGIIMRVYGVENWDNFLSKKSIYEQVEVLNKIKNIKTVNPDTAIFSCGNSFEMEYLLPKSGNFIPCERIYEQKFKNFPKILLTTMDLGRTSSVDVKPSTCCLITMREVPQEVKERCPKPDIFNGNKYSVYSCK